MSTWLTLTRRDLAGYFLNLTGYVIIAAAVFLMGFSFVVLMMKLQQEPTPMPVTEMFYITQFFWLVLLLSAPAINAHNVRHRRVRSKPGVDLKCVALRRSLDEGYVFLFHQLGAK